MIDRKAGLRRLIQFGLITAVGVVSTVGCGDAEAARKRAEAAALAARNNNPTPVGIGLNIAEVQGTAQALRINDQVLTPTPSSIQP